jgi:tRNA-specific 2-thiouridylase
MTKGKVAVALSGGVDSSVAALLLKEAGHEVVGIYACLWDSSCSERQAHQAESICRILNIPFHVVDLQREFERYVVDYFCGEYKEGQTPNPCVACNQHIKFGFLLNKALSMGADYLATGHYARIERLEDGYHLLKAKDRNRDQSYFLYSLNQERLRYILFPLASYSKAEVQEVARHGGLPVAAKPSQDICFISQKHYHAFLGQRFPSLPGDIVATQGKILGHHRGIAFYTVGQRHGLGLASGKPLYVVRIEPEHNRIVLDSGKELYSQEIAIRELNWMADEVPSEPVPVMAKIRHKSREAAATLFLEADSATVCFSQPQRAVTPGQAIVFYRGEEVLGGGIIESSQLETLDKGSERYVAASEL